MDESRVNADRSIDRSTPTRRDRGSRPTGSSDATAAAAADPVLCRLLEEAEPLRRPADVTEPWVLARKDTVLKLHDLRALDDAERRRIESEAEIGRALGELDGVVPILSVAEEGGWLIVEMPLPGLSLAEHLRRIEAGIEPRRDARAYADALAGVAETLQTMHERGLSHRDVTPESLFFDPEGRLRLADLRLTRSDAPGRSGDATGERYVAPEAHLGEVGPSIDQYALAVTAREVFSARGAPPLTDPVRLTLKRAAAPQPADRYPEIGEFGAALRSAVRKEAPRGLADRLASTPTHVRAGVEPALIAAALALWTVTDAALADRIAPGFTAFFTLATVAGYGILVWGTVTLAALARGRRTALSVELANRPPVALGVFLLIAVVSAGAGSAAVGDLVPWTLAAVYVGRSLLAPTPQGAAGWMVGLLRKWDARATLAPPRRRAISTAVPTALVALLALPAIVVAGFGKEPELPRAPVGEYGSLIAVAEFRRALGREQLDHLCRRVLTRSTAGPLGRCRQLARYAALVQAADPVTKTGRDVFGAGDSLETFEVEELPAPEGVRVWRIVTPPPRRVAGSLYTAGPQGRRIVAMISRKPPRPAAYRFRSTWLYDVVWRGRDSEWRVDGFRACTIRPVGSGRAPARCLVTDEMSPALVRLALAKVDAARRR